jgi:hypothetical protein
MLAFCAHGTPVRPQGLHSTQRRNYGETLMGKAIGWTVLIIFLIGLLVVIGFFKLIIPG